MKLSKIVALGLAGVLSTSLMAATSPLTLDAETPYTFTADYTSQVLTEGLRIAEWQPASEGLNGWTYQGGSGDAITYPLAMGVTSDDTSAIIGVTGDNTSTQFKLGTSGGQLKLAAETEEGGLVPIPAQIKIGDAATISNGVVAFSTEVKFTLSDAEIAFPEIASSGAKTAVFALAEGEGSERAFVAVAHGGHGNEDYEVGLGAGFAYLYDDAAEDYVFVTKDQPCKLQIQLKTLGGGSITADGYKPIVVFQVLVNDKICSLKDGTNKLAGASATIGFAAAGNEDDLLTDYQELGPWLMAAYYAMPESNFATFVDPEYRQVNGVAFQGTSELIANMKLATASGDEPPPVPVTVDSDATVENIDAFAAKTGNEAYQPLADAVDALTDPTTGKVAKDAFNAWINDQKISIAQLNGLFQEGGRVALENAYLCNMAVVDGVLAVPEIKSTAVTSDTLADVLPDGLTPADVVAFALSANFNLGTLNGVLAVEAYTTLTAEIVEEVSVPPVPAINPGYLHIETVSGITYMYVISADVNTPTNLFLIPTIVAEIAAE